MQQEEKKKKRKLLETSCLFSLVFAFSCFEEHFQMCQDARKLVTMNVSMRLCSRTVEVILY